MSTKISLQTFTVRKHLKTNDQIMATLQKLSGLGIHNIEVARVKFTKEEGAVIANTCHKLGMKVGSTQITYKHIMKNFDDVVVLHQLWACDYVAVSVMPMSYILKGEQGIRKFAVKLNELGERLRQKGLHLLFHHHHFEYVRYGDQTGLELIMALTNPNYVNLMMDTYWTQRGGRNPVDQLHQFHDRIKVVHLRDFKLKLSKLKRDFIIQDAALGDGNLDIKRIIETAVSYDIPYLPIEQGTKTPFIDIARSVDHIKTLGFGGLLD